MATPTTLPAAFTAGQVLTAAQMNDLRGAFRVLQVVYAETSTQAISSSSTYADTGLTATITPASTSNKVLVIFQQNGCGKEAGNAANDCSVRLVRGANVYGTYNGGATSASEVNYIGTIGSMYLDAPVSTSALTYKTQFANPANASNVRVQVSNVNTSTIILLEISA
jgi:hypothetical protein